MQCAQCATPVPEDARFCHSCGSLVSEAEGQAAATGAMDASAFQHMEQLVRDDTTGEFEILRMLGRGGMVMVYLANEVHLARKVAIKVLPPELTFGHGVERFKREAKTAAALDHPNIIPIYRVASGGEIFWYAMKYLEGQSLDDLLKERGRFSLGETIGILGQVADALDYAHERVLLIGVGLLPPGGVRDLAAGSYQVEAAANGFVTARVTAPPPPLRDLRPETPPRLITVVERCLEKDPDRRRQSLADAARELEAL